MNNIFFNVFNNTCFAGGNIFSIIFKYNYYEEFSINFGTILNSLK